MPTSASLSTRELEALLGLERSGLDAGFAVIRAFSRAVSPAPAPAPTPAPSAAPGARRIVAVAPAEARRWAAAVASTEAERGEARRRWQPRRQRQARRQCGHHEAVRRQRRAAPASPTPPPSPLPLGEREIPLKSTTAAGSVQFTFGLLAPPQLAVLSIVDARGDRRDSSTAGVAEASAVDLRVATSLAQRALHAELGDALAAALLEPIAQVRCWDGWTTPRVASHHGRAWFWCACVVTRLPGLPASQYCGRARGFRRTRPTNRCRTRSRRTRRRCSTARTTRPRAPRSTRRPPQPRSTARRTRRRPPTRLRTSRATTRSATTRVISTRGDAAASSGSGPLPPIGDTAPKIKHTHGAGRGAPRDRDRRAPRAARRARGDARGAARVLRTRRACRAGARAAGLAEVISW